MALNESQIHINSFATNSFRNVADQDYIAARVCYKNGLMLQFAWMAQQAIEKYFKAILLYNQKNTKDLGHDLNKSLRRIESIENIKLDFTEETLSFIDYINDQGPNRYLEKQHFTRGLEITSLDRTVWEIRRYCKVINYKLKLSNGEEKNCMEAELNQIHRWLYSDNQHKFILVGGYLEKVLNNSKHKQRASLVWANFYYSKRKRKFATIPRNSNMINPVHIRHPKHFEEMNKVIQFSKEVRDYFKKIQITDKSR